MSHGLKRYLLQVDGRSWHAEVTRARQRVVLFPSRADRSSSDISVHLPFMGLLGWVAEHLLLNLIAYSTAF